ncbi:MAG: ferritin-like domain-containing protein [Polyangiales bacterium]
MRTRKLLSRWFALVAASVAGTSACGLTITPALFTGNLCTADTWPALNGLSPARGVDYLELRAAGSSRAEQARGSRCATATDRARCLGAYDALAESRGWAVTVDGLAQQLVYTRGDEVGVVASAEALRTFLAPIDSPADAALLATANGFRVQCDGANLRETAAGYELRLYSGVACGRNTGLDVHVVAVSRAGEVRAVQTERVRNGDPNCVIGRGTEGVAVGAVSPEADALGAYFAEMSALEASAVLAFDRLARELDALGAPASLSARARAAARDEVRHARVTAALARRFGATPPAVASSPLPVRDAPAIAHENAVEGCMRETFGALVGTFQARAARDPAVARALRVIARDETGHAALAWDVAAWLEPQLAEDVRADLHRARAEALAALTPRDADEADPALSSAVGLPSRAQSRALLAHLRAGPSGVTRAGAVL